MIRFVDIRNQGTGHRFAFWSTSGDHFISIDGEQAWNTVAQLKEAWESRPQDFPDIGRLLRQCESRPWTAEGEDDVVGWYVDETEDFVDVLSRLIDQRDELLDTITIALPYVECAEKDTTYKPGAVAKVVAQIRAVIAKAGAA